MSKTRNFSPHILLAAVLILTIIYGIGQYSYRSARNNYNYSTAASNTEDYPLSIKFIDVGQGDSELITLPDNRLILIDAGDKKHVAAVSKAVNDSETKTIDYLIATHPHADHIGGMQEIVENFEVKNIYMPKTEHDSKTYLSLLETISAKHLKINTVKAGTVMIDEPDLKAEFLAPCNNGYDELNDYSAVLKLTYKNNGFLFCGDAETLSENEILSSEYDVSADVLKVGHHGSKTSTSNKFLNAVNPQCAVISCGLNNSYNHPSEETLKKLKTKNISVFRTDKMGTITLYSDGTEIKIITEKD